MTTILDTQLFAHAARVKDRVVVITGGANGIGRETAGVFAKHGANVVVGDLDVAGGQAVVADITAAGGHAVFSKCDVLVWDDLVDLFDLALKWYGSVDIVIPNAGVTDRGNACNGFLKLKDGRPQPPTLTTLHVNLTAVVQTVHLGLYHIKTTRTKDDLKAIVLLGSMASWQAIPGGTQYSAAKHGALGLMRSLYESCSEESIRVAIVHPWFSDTAIVPPIAKLALAGIPKTPLTRIAHAIFAAASDPDPDTSGCAWLLPDDGPVFRLARVELKEGVYGMVDARLRRAKGIRQSVLLAIGLVRDVAGVLGGRRVLALCLVVGAWRSGLVARVLDFVSRAAGCLRHHCCCSAA